MFKSILDFLFPPACFLCESATSHSEFVCQSCLYELQQLTELELAAFRRGYLNNHFKGCFIPFQFDSLSQRLIHLLKYHHGHPVAELMIKLLTEQFLPELQALHADVILPCPLHPRKQIEREYNQAELMAAALSKTLNIPMDTKALSRTRYTKTQTRLNKKQREKNLLNCFQFENSQSYKTILLIDDVITTGTTLNKLANVIIEQNPNVKLYAIAFASSVRR